MSNVLPPIQFNTLASNIELGSPNEVAHLSAKGAALTTARALKADANTPTSHLENFSPFQEGRDATDAGAYVRHKPERYAIAAVFVDVATDSLVTNPPDARDARFIALPDTGDSEVSENLMRQGWGRIMHAGMPGMALKADISGAVFPIRIGFLDTHPELVPAARRYESISKWGEDMTFDVEMNSAEGVIDNITEAMQGLVIDAYIPLAQRLLAQEAGNPDLATKKQRLNAVKDGAQKILFTTAAINMGHLLQFNRNEGPWTDFAIGDELQGSFARLPSGEWDIKIKPGSERPAKPKEGLAGATISCPALLQLEADDAASPLHRMVYATINEASERGFFSDEGLADNLQRIETLKIWRLSEDDKIRKILDSIVNAGSNYTPPPPPMNP
ncbi:hypothetical protein BH10PAT3_BH10PAT3_0490 [soil metagenome]